KRTYRGLPQWTVEERILQEETKATKKPSNRWPQRVERSGWNRAPEMLHKETKQTKTESKPSFVPSSAGSRTYGVGQLFLRAVEAGRLLDGYCFSLPSPYCLRCANPHLA